VLSLFKQIAQDYWLLKKVKRGVDNGKVEGTPRSDRWCSYTAKFSPRRIIRPFGKNPPPPPPRVDIWQTTLMRSFRATFWCRRILEREGIIWPPGLYFVGRIIRPMNDRIIFGRLEYAALRRGQRLFQEWGYKYQLTPSTLRQHTLSSKEHQFLLDLLH
jgi:hypothetical protein